MIKGYATSEGTERFANRFTNVGDFYTDLDGLKVSSVGFGTFAPEAYKEENYEYSFAEALEKGVRNGANLLDTAANYRYRQSEREMGEAIKKVIDEGKAARDELVVMTKAGFIPLDYPFPENPYTWIEEEVVAKGLAKKEEIVMDQYCMAPDFLEWSLDVSLERLGLECADVLFLHNPDFMIGDDFDRNALYEKIGEAFARFEQMADAGKIRSYGVATWDSFTLEPEDPRYMGVLDLVKLAEQAGGENHRFKYLQLAYNLAKPHAYAYTNQPLEDGKFYSTFQAAHKLGLHVVASSSLMRMNLFKGPFSKKIADILGEELPTDVQRALQFVRSAPGVAAALVGTKTPEHALLNMTLRTARRVEPENYQKIFGL